MMDDLSLDDLLSGLQAAQQKKSTVQLSERNIIELVNKLRQLGFLGDEILHTSNGREYITRDKLRDEVASAIEQAGGRIPLVDLPSALAIDFAHCERAANEVIDASKGNIILAHGDLISVSYFDNLAVEVDHSLQESGIVIVGDLARRFGLGVEMLQNALQARLGSTVHGRLENGVVYTASYLARVKAQIRGALRGTSSPVQLSMLRKDLGLEGLGRLSAVVPTLIDELQAEKSLSGKIISGNSTWVPDTFSAAQHNAVKTFYQQNSYALYDMATKNGITNPAKYMKEAFPDGIPLSFSYVSPSVLHLLEAAIEDAQQNSSWCDATTTVPSALSNDDVVQLVQKCTASISAKGSKILASTCVVSAPFIDSIVTVLKEEASAAAQEAHAKRKTKSVSGAASSAAAHTNSNSNYNNTNTKNKGGNKNMRMDDDSDDDWDTGKGKGKKGKSGGKKGKSTAAAPTASKKSSASTAAPSASAETPSLADSLFLSPENLQQRILHLHPDVEYAGVDNELADALTDEIRPFLVSEYERALSVIFTAGAEKRRRVKEAASQRLQSMYQKLQLHAHGAELFAGDESTYGIIQKHVLRSDGPLCADALLHFLKADMASEEGDGGDTVATTTTEDATGQSTAKATKSPEDIVSEVFTPAARASTAKECAGEARDAVGALVAALASASTTLFQYIEALDEATSASGMRVKKIEKKIESVLVKEQQVFLQNRVELAEDAALLLAAVLPYLIAKHRGRCVSLPGRALGPAVESLRDVLDDEEYGLLKKFHAAVVEHLKSGDEGNADGENLSVLMSSVKSKLAS